MFLKIYPYDVLEGLTSWCAGRSTCAWRSTLLRCLTILLFICALRPPFWCAWRTALPMCSKIYTFNVLEDLPVWCAQRSTCPRCLKIYPSDVLIYIYLWMLIAAVFWFYLNEINLFSIMFIWERDNCDTETNQGKCNCIVKVALTSSLPQISLNYPCQANEKQMLNKQNYLSTRLFLLIKLKYLLLNPKSKSNV